MESVIDTYKARVKCAKKITKKAKVEKVKRMIRYIYLGVAIKDSKEKKKVGRDRLYDTLHHYSNLLELM